MNKNKHRYFVILIPLIIAVSIVIGIIVGNSFSNKKYISDTDRKLNTILNLIGEEYVDSVNLNDVIEMTIPKILSNLDPHSSYIPSSELKKVNDDLEGSFYGIGITFTMMNDTIMVIEVLDGGPSKKAGLLAGDRIISVNDSSIVSIDQDKVKERFRGAKDSIVKLGIKRKDSNSVYYYNISRGEIPVNTVPAYYMMDKETGYIKISKFGRSTYDEFITDLSRLKSEGAKRFVIDLRGNGGGLLEAAILMANEFLPENQLIVYTKGREKKDENQYWSDGNGSFLNNEVVVLLDETSASASEIFAGALQDNDRGLIIGRRSFGKGLVQQQIMLPDSSAIRLTVARYYTPSGRSIQKEFIPGDEDAYYQELYDRYNNGEVYNRDSVKMDDKKIFHTLNNREVYGGGGIMPDIFVANDTAGISSYYVKVANAGLFQKYAFKYVDLNRESFNKMKDYKEYLRKLPSDDVLLNDFVNYASRHGIRARWYYINQSRKLILSQLKAVIASDIFGTEAYYPIINADDKTLQETMKAFKQKKAAYPIVQESKKN